MKNQVNHDGDAPRGDGSGCLLAGLVALLSNGAALSFVLRFIALFVVVFIVNGIVSLSSFTITHCPYKYDPLYGFSLINKRLVKDSTLDECVRSALIAVQMNYYNNPDFIGKVREAFINPNSYGYTVNMETFDRDLGIMQKCIDDNHSFANCLGLYGYKLNEVGLFEGSYSHIFSKDVDMSSNITSFFVVGLSSNIAGVIALSRGRKKVYSSSGPATSLSLSFFFGLVLVFTGIACLYYAVERFRMII
jgi:hypothetical protein